MVDRVTFRIMFAPVGKMPGRTRRMLLLPLPLLLWPVITCFGQINDGAGGGLFDPPGASTRPSQADTRPTDFKSLGQQLLAAKDRLRQAKATATARMEHTVEYQADKALLDAAQKSLDAAASGPMEARLQPARDKLDARRRLDELQDTVVTLDPAVVDATMSLQQAQYLYDSALAAAAAANNEAEASDQSSPFDFSSISVPNSATPQNQSYGSDGNKTVFVNGYYRNDGTYVHSYMRSPPGMGSGRR